MTTVAGAFVGCKVSQADNDEALAALRAAGCESRPRGEADLVVVHTCCVTAEAERKSRRLVRRLARGGCRVVVAGCAATLHPERFAGAGVELVGGHDWRELVAAPGVDAAAPVAVEAREEAAPAAPGRTRVVVKVQDGCAASCAYCAVRLVRGVPRSRPLDEVVATVRRSLAAGCGEVVLSGIDLGAWREGELELADLVVAACEAPPLDVSGRIRLSSIEPGHLGSRLLEALAHPRVARHLHVPLQSADDVVLAAMRRPYTFAQYRATVARVRERLGGVMLSTDVIAGFPVEDEAAFARTLGAIEGGMFGRVHVFGFSARPGTAAAELPPLPATVVKERVGRALAAAGAAAASARRAALGRPAVVLVEDRRDGFWRGYSSEYVRFYLSGGARPGALVKAVAEEEHDDGVKGRIV